MEFLNFLISDHPASNNQEHRTTHPENGFRDNGCYSVIFNYFAAEKMSISLL